MKFTSIIAAIITLIFTACGDKKSVQENFSKSSQYKYSLSVNGCDTGTHEFDSKEAIVLHLKMKHSIRGAPTACANNYTQQTARNF